MKIENNVNSQHTFISVSNNPRKLCNGSYIFSVNPLSNIYNGIIFYHGIKSSDSCCYKLKIEGAIDTTLSANTLLYKGDSLGTRLNDNFYQVIYNDSRSFYLLDMYGAHVSTEYLSSAYANKIRIGNGFIENVVKFNYKIFYLNLLDSVDEKKTYGDNSKVFTYSSEYFDEIDVKEGHIYMLSRLNKKIQLDGRQSASILGRNVQNCENILPILANNINICERALDRILDIARRLKVEINLDS